MKPILQQPEIRRDTVRPARSFGRARPDAQGRRVPAGFDRPALVVWAREDASCPPSTGVA